MLVTLNTLVGYTILNGTVGLQMALLAGSVYNLCVFNDSTVASRKLFTSDEIDTILRTRKTLIGIHSSLMVINLITHSHRFQAESIK